ncbi:23S rRNA (pseudouridine(1915)-N(3))-methyltransferase RlmH [Candidatus Gracilibacteria bacterium]|nr:23S rRNA (pseudouridine(1915)-N(3))-methyltransferase RlmH [Candidatus Gracilibacteria bacterium]MCF7819510.1 23S rRNA (pseudouridine(1915)-N(3))-methyltransferase RlmH [Candidatus Gracilibacteria bacterium]
MNKKIVQQDFLIALDEKGEQMNSIEFSQFLKKIFVDHETAHIVLGGAYGLSDKILHRADKKISFGPMVWTRNLARLMTLEQLYRALEIDGGGNFHKSGYIVFFPFYLTFYKKTS